MKPTYIGTMAVIFVGVFVASAQNPLYPKAMITVHVVDEEGNPVVGAKSGGAFEIPKMSGLGTESIAHESSTNSNGNVTSTGETSDGYVFYGARKEGYYRTANLRYLFKERKENRWQPWNPKVEVVLKRIVKPIPMYAKHVDQNPGRCDGDRF